MKRITLFLVALTLAIAGASAASPGTSDYVLTLDNGFAQFDQTVSWTLTPNFVLLKGWQYAMVDTTCYQDVNEDGVIDMDNLGPDIVYGHLENRMVIYHLGNDGTSIWSLRGGGPAECRTNYDLYGWRGGREYISVLASVSYHAEG